MPKIRHVSVAPTEAEAKIGIEALFYMLDHAEDPKNPLGVKMPPSVRDRLIARAESMRAKLEGALGSDN